MNNLIKLLRSEVSVYLIYLLNKSTLYLSKNEVFKNNISKKKKIILTFTLRIELLLFPSYKKLGFLRVNPSPPCSIIFSNSSSKCSFPLHFENFTI